MRRGSIYLLSACVSFVLLPVLLLLFYGGRAPPVEGSYYGDSRVFVPRRPASWDDVRFLVATDQITFLGRSLDGLNQYIEGTKRLTEKYGSIYQAVMTRVFHCDRASCEKDELVLAPNDFPYYLEDGIEHLILWKHPEGKHVTSLLTPAEIEPALEYHGTKQCVYWLNPVARQSIGNISHAHVLCKHVH